MTVNPSNVRLKDPTPQWWGDAEIDGWWDNLRPSLRRWYHSYNEEPEEVELFLEASWILLDMHLGSVDTHEAEQLRHELEWCAW